MSIQKEVESLLFVADKPVTVAALADCTGHSEEEIIGALDQLSARLEEFSGLQLVVIAGGYQLCTRAEYAESIGRFLKPQKQRFGRSLMEVLAIVAYQQPITMAEIDAIRGVQSDYGVRQLLERRLIKEVGRRPTPGRPMLYGTTSQFLHQFNMNDLGDLPELSVSLPAGAPTLPASTEADN